MKGKFKLAVAGNIEPPIYFLLLEKGYEIYVEGSNWIAENDSSTFIAENIIELAGLILLYEQKGENWSINDDLIDDFTNKFG